MKTLMLGLLPVVGFLVIMGSAIAVDRLREPRRDPTRPHAVVDQRTFADACRRIDRLVNEGGLLVNLIHVRTLLTSMHQWLRMEIHSGPARRKARRVMQLDQVQMAQEQTAQLIDGVDDATLAAAHQRLAQIATLSR